MVKRKENKPYSELTKREKFLVENPNLNKNKGYGGYYKWYTLSNSRVGADGTRYLGARCRGWFWRDKPTRSKK